MKPEARHSITVSEQDHGLRLDKWLSTLAFIPSRSRAAELIDQGRVTLNGKALKASFKLKAQDQIVIDLPSASEAPSTLLPLERPIDILFEDDDLVVVNKPSGLVVHPAAGHAQDTLVNILLHHVDQLSMGFHERRPGIVHRLDRDTSGILVVAKNDLAHQALASQFKDKSAHRLYWALVHGIPRAKKGRIESHLGRHPSDRKKFCSQPGQRGKLAITHYQVLKTSSAPVSWIACRLETGRTHQIRVHLSELGHPIVGDPIYGFKSPRPADRRAPRLALHACELGFKHPRTRKDLSFKVDWPPDLADFVVKERFADV